MPKKDSKSYLTIYLPNGKKDLRQRIYKVARRKRRPVNKIMIDMIESYLKIFE